MENFDKILEKLLKILEKICASVEKSFTYGSYCNQILLGPNNAVTGEHGPFPHPCAHG